MKGDHIDVEAVARRATAALERLGKWRSFFAAWQLGTRSDTDGECKAVRDHREITILLRAELTALTGLLIEKGVFTQVEFTEALGREAEQLDRDYARRFPGIESSEHGLVYDPATSLQTMRNLGFPP